MRLVFKGQFIEREMMSSNEALHIFMFVLKAIVGAALFALFLAIIIMRFELMILAGLCSFFFAGQGRRK